MDEEREHSVEISVCTLRLELLLKISLTFHFFMNDVKDSNISSDENNPTLSISAS